MTSTKSRKTQAKGFKPKGNASRQGTAKSKGAPKPKDTASSQGTPQAKGTTQAKGTPKAKGSTLVKGTSQIKGTTQTKSTTKLKDTPPSKDTPITASLDSMPELTHAQILEVLSGLLIALFVTNLSGTIVNTALPRITAALQANEQQYLWVVTATLLASTASTPIWGKLADLFNKKKLLMIGLVVFILGSALSGSATSPMFLIAARAFQGIGLGAMMSLVQAVIATIIPPRKRGRYMAYTGATMAVATVIGPLAGGFLVDAPHLGWRWCFWSAVPIAIIALIILQVKLTVPVFRREGTKVDWLGATLITASVSSLLIWISFVTKDYAWISWQTFALVGFSLVTAGFVILVESKVHDPIIPLGIITMRTTALAILASISVGVGMFGASVFLSQYFQFGRGLTPTESGLMNIPMMGGVLISSLVIGRLVSKTGYWKPFVVAGAILLTAGFAAMSTITDTTSYWVIGAFMVVSGLGLGMTMQNLVLAVQNSISVRDVGAASASVTFFRSLGGTMGISILGFIFQNRLTSQVTGGATGLIQQAVMSDIQSNPALAPVCGALQNATPDQMAQIMTQCPNTSQLLGDLTSAQSTGGTSMDLSQFTYDPFRILMEQSIGNSIGRLFLIGAVVSALSIIAILFMRSTKLRTHFEDAPA
ncbi:MAG: MFS transporter [Propionibacteriaceae bacterium]|nr:MFS transporter [Propionibacteriaceae bacterium]